MDIERCRTVTEDDVHALKKEFYDVKVQFVDTIHESKVDKDKLHKEIKGISN